MSRYQGLVALDGGSLEDAAHEYFLRSEQIPTRVRLAVGEEWRGGEGAETSLARRRHAAAVSAQGAGAGAAGRFASGRRAGRHGRRMRRGRRCLDRRPVADRTVEDIELIDPDLSGERLLYRLFHERGVRVFAPMPLRAQCSCSRDAVSSMLKSFAPKDRAEMVKDGKVVVTCEFCSSVYQFTRRSRRGVVGGKYRSSSPANAGDDELG